MSSFLNPVWVSSELRIDLVWKHYLSKRRTQATVSWLDGLEGLSRLITGMISCDHVKRLTIEPPELI